MTAGWGRLPVDDIGYLPPADLLALPDDRLRALIMAMEQIRYRGWRNHEGRWRDVLGLDSTSGRLVLDYGCGVGVEALQYAKTGNRVWLADLTRAGVALAARVLELHGHAPAGTSLIAAAGPPFIRWPGRRPQFDVIHLAGVLHHIRQPHPVMAHLRRWLTPTGQVRLLLYSDEGWRVATGTDPPLEVLGHPSFAQYVEYQDGVGGYADWYDQDRLTERFGDLYAVDRCEYVGPDRRLLAAVLRPRPREVRGGE